MWIQMNRFPSDSVALFECGQGSSRLYDIVLAIDPTGFLTLQLFKLVVIGGANSISALSLGSWSHLTLSWDGSTAKIYINGALASNANSGGTSLLSVSLPTTQCGFGFLLDNSADGLNADLDEIRVYSRLRIHL